jgi:murein DD-endopeptidase MepM/ murein hydrolase activator NlpD
MAAACLVLAGMCGCAHSRANHRANKATAAKSSSVPKRASVRTTRSLSNAAPLKKESKTPPVTLNDIAKYNAKFENVDNAKRISLKWPLAGGVILKNFNSHPDTLHEGLTIGAPLDTEVKAAAEGTVLYAGDESAFFGNVVIISHSSPFITVYAYLNQIKVAVGAKIAQGAIIGTVGNNPQYQSPALYFQVRKNRTPDNPELYLAGVRS